MIIGKYRLRPIRKAFKNDFCLACDAERISVLVRTLNVMRIYWIPLIPYGFRSRWVCSACGRDPHVRTKTRRWVISFASVFFGFTCVLLAFGAVIQWNANKEGATTLSNMALILLISSLALGISAARQQTDVDLKEKLQKVAPNTAVDCPFCGEPLWENPYWHCPICNVERR
jgi:hypothetical protein